MSRTKYLKGECQHCGGRLEYPAEAIGTIADCPHCQQQTELRLAIPPEEPALPRRIVIWTAISVLILGLGLLGALIALKRAQRWAARQKRPIAGLAATTPTNSESGSAADAPAQKDFAISPVTLEKAADSSLIYAVGTVRNTSDHQRFGVQVELDLLDDMGRKLGTAKDYHQVLDAGAEWKFRALVVDSNATTAKVAGIKEDQ